MRALALLIGNAAYPKPHDLNNASNDARDLSNALTSLGFVSKSVLDATINEMDTAIDEFCNDLSNFEVGLFFYAGHGFQEAGENYLTAVDTTFTTMSAKRGSMELGHILRYMERAKNKMNIIILDACRDELENLGRRRGVESHSLAPVFAPRGTIIAFSTSPGQTARDGLATDGNGVYTRALLNHISTEKIGIEEFFKRVCNTVYSATNEEQITWEHTSLTSNFEFNSGLVTHASAGKYASFAIADAQYNNSGEPVLAGIIEDLKSRNWYDQRPAIRRLSQINPATADPNLLFILGRNILQSAEGTEKDAKRFMDNLKNRLMPFQTVNGNPVLEGIMFEMYFNKNGLLRDEQKGVDFMDDVMGLKDDPHFSKSFEFINEELKRFKDKLYYTPEDSETAKSIDVFLEEREYKSPWSDDENEMEIDYLVKSISINGQTAMTDEKVDGIRMHHEELTFARFKRKVAELLGIPPKKLIVNSNIQMKEDSPIRFLWDAKLRRSK